MSHLIQCYECPTIVQWEYSFVSDKSGEEVCASCYEREEEE